MESCIGGLLSVFLNPLSYILCDLLMAHSFCRSCFLTEVFDVGSAFLFVSLSVLYNTWVYLIIVKPGQSPSLTTFKNGTSRRLYTI